MPDPLLSSDAVRQRLRTTFLGQEVSCFESTPSTQDEARSRALGGAPEGTLVLANEQTAGRGRFGRAWRSPRGQGLHASLVLYPTLWMLARLGFVVSVAVVRALRDETGLTVAAKWPNDILVHGRKVAGILIESEVTGETVRFAILGIGINVNLDVAAYPDIASSATSLAAETGHPCDRLSVLVAVLHHLEPLYLDLRQGHVPLQEWRDLLETLGKHVLVRSGNDLFSGLARDVDEEGNLVLALPDGSTVTVTSGDVTLQA